MRVLSCNNHRRFITFIIIIAICSIFMILLQSCTRPAPLKLEDLSVTMPGDEISSFDIYRVVAVKKDVTKQELVALMEYFTKTYLDKNRVMIYVFNSTGGAHLGQSENLIATYFQDKKAKKYVREILLDQPGKDL